MSIDLDEHSELQSQTFPQADSGCVTAQEDAIRIELDGVTVTEKVETTTIMK